MVTGALQKGVCHLANALEYLPLPHGAHYDSRVLVGDALAATAGGSLGHASYAYHLIQVEARLLLHTSL